jgi:hypothetical protein
MSQSSPIAKPNFERMSENGKTQRHSSHSYDTPFLAPFRAPGRLNTSAHFLGWLFRSKRCFMMFISEGPTETAQGLISMDTVDTVDTTPQRGHLISTRSKDIQSFLRRMMGFFSIPSFCKVCRMTMEIHGASTPHYFSLQGVVVHLAHLTHPIPVSCHLLRQAERSVWALHCCRLSQKSHHSRHIRVISHHVQLKILGVAKNVRQFHGVPLAEPNTL